MLWRAAIWAVLVVAAAEAFSIPYVISVVSPRRRAEGQTVKSHGGLHFGNLVSGFAPSRSGVNLRVGSVSRPRASYGAIGSRMASAEVRWRSPSVCFQSVLCLKLLS